MNRSKLKQIIKTLILEECKKTSELVEETRKHGPEQYKTVSKAIKQYKNKENIYMHFSEDFTDSKDQLINQFGINVEQDYGNPFGIYAYPMTGKINGMFKTKAEYAYVLKNNTPADKAILDINELSQTQYVDMLDKLKQYVATSTKVNETGFLSFMKQTEQKGKFKSDGGLLFYLIVRMSLSDKYNIKGTREGVYQSMIWDKVLGINFIQDNGTGIIHVAEPHQALWTNSKYIEIIEVVKNHDEKYNKSKIVTDENGDKRLVRDLPVETQYANAIIKLLYTYSDTKFKNDIDNMKIYGIKADWAEIILNVLEQIHIAEVDTERFIYVLKKAKGIAKKKLTLYNVLFRASQGKGIELGLGNVKKLHRIFGKYITYANDPQHKMPAIFTLNNLADKDIVGISDFKAILEYIKTEWGDLKDFDGTLIKDSEFYKEVLANK